MLDMKKTKLTAEELNEWLVLTKIISTSRKRLTPKIDKRLKELRGKMNQTEVTPQY